MVDLPAGFGAGLFGFESLEGSSFESGVVVGVFDLAEGGSVVESGSLVDLRATFFGVGSTFLDLSGSKAWLVLGSGLVVGSGGISVYRCKVETGGEVVSMFEELDSRFLALDIPA